MVKLVRLMAILLASLCLTGTALAHASLIGSSPAPNRVLSSAPTQLVLEFNEPVSPLVLTLIGPKGSSSALTGFKLVDGSVIVPAPTGMDNGTFALSYRVVSEDGHPVAGSVIFSIGAASGDSTGAPADAVDWPLRIAVWLDKTAVYVGLLFGVAGVFFWWMTARVSLSPAPIRAALVVGMVAASLSVGLQGLDLLGRPPSGLLDSAVWAAGFDTSLGLSALIAFAAMTLAMLGTLIANRRRSVILSSLGFIGIGLAFSATGHASAADPQWLTRPAVFVHGVSTAYWIGALVPLWVLLRNGSTSALPALSRFSRTIPFVLVGLIASGSTLAVIQLGGLGALLTTAYGLVFSIKLGLVAVLLLLATVNRWWLTKPTERGDAAAIRHLTLALAIEMILALAILGTVATWRFTPPPRISATVSSEPLEIDIQTEQGMATVIFSSDVAGPMSADIYLMGADMGPLDAKALTVELSNTSAGVEATRYQATKDADGKWRVDGIVIPLGGSWSLNLAVRVSEFQMIRLKDSVEFGKR